MKDVLTEDFKQITILAMQKEYADKSDAEIMKELRELSELSLREPIQRTQPAKYLKFISLFEYLQKRRG